MRVNKASYLDDGINIPGVLIERFLRKPIFYSSDLRCGWDSQKITKKENDKVVVWIGTSHAGKFYVHGGKKKKEREK